MHGIIVPEAGWIRAGITVPAVGRTKVGITALEVGLTRAGITVLADGLITDGATVPEAGGIQEAVEQVVSLQQPVWNIRGFLMIVPSFRRFVNTGMCLYKRMTTFAAKC